MEFEVAKQINDLMLCYAAKLDESLLLVKKNSSEEEYLKYRSAIGTIMGTMYLDIMKIIYNEHPSLKPQDL